MVRSIGITAGELGHGIRADTTNEQCRPRAPTHGSAAAPRGAHCDAQE